MLYKVTPAMEAPTRKKAGAGEGPRKRRKSAVFDSDGNEVLISLMCLKCKTVKPLTQFGLRKMPDGALRNQPWCKGCRGAVPKKEPVAEAAPQMAVIAAPAEPLPLAAEPLPIAAEPNAVMIVAPVSRGPLPADPGTIPGASSYGGG